MTGYEWETNWGFIANHFVTFIRQGLWKSMPVEEFNSQAVQNQPEDDVWVFNGLKLYQESGKDALNSISWKKLGREFILRIHRGANEEVQDPVWQENFTIEGRDNNRDFLAQAVTYSGSDPLFQLIQKFADAEKKGPDEYDRALSRLSEALGIERSRLQDVVDLLQMFLPLDIQLQLNDPEVSGCKREADILDGKLATIATLLGRITRKEITPEQVKTVVARSGDGDSIGLVRRLMTYVQHVRKSDKRSDMSAIFGFNSESSSSNDNAGSLEPKGFHCTYKRLRDTLLELVDRD
jgi:hypothetical protein